MTEKQSSKEDILNFSDEGGSSVIDAKSMRNMKKLSAVFDSAKKSVCKVAPAHKEQGTGAFYEVVDGNGIDRFIFMTCNHVLPTNSLNEIAKAIFEFEDIQQLTSFSINKTDVKYIWTTKIYDATIIEISIDIATVYKNYGVKFLKVGQLTAGNEVAILQYPKGKFGIAYGDIDHINGNDVFYQIGTAPGSSGSPLLNWDCKALAMHKAGVIGATEDRPDIWRKASALTAIVEAYLEDQANDRLQNELDKSKTENIALKQKLKESEQLLDSLRSKFKDMEKLNDIVQKKSRELEESLKNANIENLSLKAKSTQNAANAKAEMYLS